MKCPKCGHQQANAQECEACGIVFQKYYQVQKRKKEAAAQKELEKKSSFLPKLLQLCLLVAVVAGVTYYFTLQQNEAGKKPAAEQATASSLDESLPQGISDAPSKTKNAKAAKTSKTGEMLTAQGAIAVAKKATVTIETGWSTGSGFFVDANYIVTNRHVVEFDDSKLVAFRDKLAKVRELVELERQKIAGMKKQMRQLPPGPDKKQLAIIIESRKAEVAKVLPDLEKGEARLAEMEASADGEIKIILSDGSEHFANSVVFSDTYDLALISLYVQEWSPIKRAAPNTALRQGDKVYTIGSPAGLRQTVTSGIFSGYRTRTSDGQLYLQTDAPINPGNSGGPLIDENGRARGVNTMILKDTEGIGFAIPIDVVFEEFNIF